MTNEELLDDIARAIERTQKALSTINEIMGEK